MFKKKGNNWEFPFLWAWNTEDTAYHLNKADFTNFKGGNLGLTKKELMWATFVRSSFIVLRVNNTSTTAKQTLLETYQYLTQLNKLLALLASCLGESLNSQKSDFSSLSKFQTVLCMPSFRASWMMCLTQLPI